MIRSTSLVTSARVLGVALAVAAVALSPRAARADGDDAFRRGKQLLDEGHVTEACVALVEADHDQPSVATIGLLAACHEKEGRTATAWREYRETARRAAEAHDERERYASERAAKIEPLVPRLVLHLPRGEKLSVSLGGVPLGAATLAAAVRRDPGPVEIVVTSPEGKRWSTTVQLEPSEERVVEVPSLAPAASEPARRRTGAPPWPAVLAGGIGVVGIGVTTGFGISAMTQNADSVTVEDRCRRGVATAAQCDAAKKERGRALTFANVATGGLVVGAAGLGTAAVLWMLDVGGAKKAAPSASVAWTSGPASADVGLGLRARF